MCELRQSADGTIWRIGGWKSQSRLMIDRGVVATRQTAIQLLELWGRCSLTCCLITMLNAGKALVLKDQVTSSSNIVITMRKK